jgi:F-type H+-transporting ATPase subunit delta
MPKQVSGGRYAKALFELATEHAQIDAWLDQLEFVVQVLSDDDFKALLNHAEVSVQKKRDAVETVLPDIEPMIRNLVSLLVARGSVSAIGDIYQSYLKMVDVQKGRERVEVTSAVDLDDDQIQHITEFVKQIVNKEIVISTEVDESILGGIVIQIGDQLLDGSTKTQLENLRKQVRSEVLVTGH